MKRIYQAGFKYSLCEDFSFSEVQEKLDHPDEETVCFLSSKRWMIDCWEESRRRGWLCKKLIRTRGVRVFLDDALMGMKRETFLECLRESWNSKIVSNYLKICFCLTGLKRRILISIILLEFEIKPTLFEIIIKIC